MTRRTPVEGRIDRGTPNSHGTSATDGQSTESRCANNYPLLLESESMPDWVEGVLTPKQAQQKSPVWKWKRLVYALKLPGIAKALAIDLAEHCRDDQARCWTSFDRLASETGFSSRALKNAAPVLERVCLVVVERQRDASTKRQCNNTYWLAWPMFPVDNHKARVHEMHPGSAPDAPGVVHDVHPEPSAADALEVSISQGPTEGSIEAPSRSAFKERASEPSRVDTLRFRCYELFAQKGYSEDDCARAINQLRAAGIGDLVIEEALGQCENAQDRVEGLGYLVAVTRDWFKQRTGVDA